MRPGDCCVDVGAHGGAWTWLLAAACGPTGVVHAVEALPHHARALRWALRLRGLRQVRVHAVALSDREGRAELVITDGAGGDLTGRVHLRAPGEGAREAMAVATTTLDRLAAADSEIARARFLKIDVEGAEGLVLRGARDVLREARPVLLCEISDARARAFGDTRAGVLAELADLGYAPHLLETSGPIRVEPDDPRLAEDVLLLPVGA